MAIERTADNAAGEVAKPAWFKRPLFLMFSVVAVLLGLLILCAYIWFHSTSDLEDVRDYARSKGVALTYEELLGPDAGVEAALHMLERLVKLSERLEDFSYSAYAQALPNFHVIPSCSGDCQIWPGMEVAFEIRHYYHEKHEQVVIANVTELLHGLEVYGGRYLSAQDKHADNAYLSVINGLSIFLCEYALCAENAEAFNFRLNHLMALLRTMPEGEVIDSLVQMGTIGSLINVVFIRFDEIEDGTIESLRNLQEYFLVYHLRSFSMEAAYLFQSYTDNFNLHGTNTLHEIESWEELELLLARRYYRAQHMRAYVDYVEQAQLGWSAFSNPGLQLRSVPQRRGSLKDEVNPMYYLAGVHESAMKTLMYFDLLFAEYDKTPWPNDIYGNQLLPIKKDGKTIGAYSMGEDGIDDGWEKEFDEREIWLYDHIER